MLKNFYVQAEVKREKKIEFYHYKKVTMLQKFTFKGFFLKSFGDWKEYSQQSLLKTNEEK